MDQDASTANPVVTWPSAIVACFLTVLVGAVAVTAIIRYPIDDALQIWSSLGTLVGILTGAVVTYFFTRGAVESAKQEAGEEKVRAETTQQALVKTVGYLDPQMWQDLQADPNIQRAMAPPRRRAAGRGG